MRWRRYLIEIPARITEVASAWYRLYMIAILFLAGPVLLVGVIGMLGLWFLFGIRWGW